jgi:hypothetical protein
VAGEDGEEGRRGECICLLIKVSVSFFLTVLFFGFMQICAKISMHTHKFSVSLHAYKNSYANIICLKCRLFAAL